MSGCMRPAAGMIGLGDLLVAGWASPVTGVGPQRGAQRSLQLSLTMFPVWEISRDGGACTV